MHMVDVLQESFNLFSAREIKRALTSTPTVTTVTLDCPSVDASTAGLCGLDSRQQPFLRH
jgi:hypothetical protein